MSSYEPSTLQTEDCTEELAQCLADDECTTFFFKFLYRNF